MRRPSAIGLDHAVLDDRDMGTEEEVGDPWSPKITSLKGVLGRALQTIAELCPSAFEKVSRPVPSFSFLAHSRTPVGGLLFRESPSVAQGVRSQLALHRSQPGEDEPSAIGLDRTVLDDRDMGMGDPLTRIF